MKSSPILAYLLVFLFAPLCGTSFAHNATATTRLEISNQLQEMGEQLQDISRGLGTEAETPGEIRSIILSQDANILRAQLRREQMKKRLMLEKLRELQKLQPAALLDSLSRVFGGCSATYDPLLGTTIEVSPATGSSLFSSSVRKGCYSVDILKATHCIPYAKRDQDISLIDFPGSGRHTYIIYAPQVIRTVFQESAERSSTSGNSERDINYEVDFTIPGTLPQITLSLTTLDDNTSESGSVMIINSATFNGLKVRVLDTRQEFLLNNFSSGFIVNEENIVLENENGNTGGLYQNQVLSNETARIIILDLINFLRTRLPAIANGLYTLDNLPECPE